MTERRGGIKKQQVQFQKIEDGTRLPIPVELSYDKKIPYEVGITFFPEEPDKRTWTAGRDLVRKGTQTEGGKFAGLMDVKVGTSDLDEGILILELHSPDGCAIFEAKKDPLVTFLNKTEKIVPSGEEMKHIDIDETIKKLLTRPYPWK